MCSIWTFWQTCDETSIFQSRGQNRHSQGLDIYNIISRRHHQYTLYSIFNDITKRQHGELKNNLSLFTLQTTSLLQLNFAYSFWNNLKVYIHYSDAQNRHLIIRCSWRRQTSLPVPPPEELDETFASPMILAHSLHYVKTWCHPQSRKYITYCVAIRGGPSHGHKLEVHKIWWNLDVWFWDMPQDRQTDKQTRWLQYFSPLQEVE